MEELTTFINAQHEVYGIEPICKMWSDHITKTSGESGKVHGSEWCAFPESVC